MLLWRYSVWVWGSDTVSIALPLQRMPLSFRRWSKCLYRNFGRDVSCHKRWTENILKAWFRIPADQVFLRKLWHAYLCQKPSSTGHVGFKNWHIGRSLLVSSEGSNLLHWSTAVSHHTQRCSKFWENTAAQVIIFTGEEIISDEIQIAFAPEFPRDLRV